MQIGFDHTLRIIDRLLSQTRNSKDKIYSLHEHDVDCISKGKAHKKYEFGCKTSLVITHKEGLVMSAMSFHGNPYDGHTLNSALENAENLTGRKINEAFVDKGYRGHSVTGTKVYISGQKKGITKSLHKHLKRRQAIEPNIGHMKSNGKLKRNFLRGKIGDLLNATLCGIGHNLRMIMRKLIPFRIPKVTFLRV